MCRVYAKAPSSGRTRDPHAHSAGARAHSPARLRLVDGLDEQTLPAGSASGTRARDADAALVARATRGESRARRTLVQRLVLRVRRGATALLGAGPDSDDASVAALIEIVRASATFQSALGLHSWADRVTARTVVHHAHAQVRPPRDPSRVQARSLDELFGALSSAGRELFVLVHVFGMPLREVVSLVGTSELAAREELEHARLALVRVALGHEQGEPELGALRHLWAAWDRAGPGSGERPSALLPSALRDMGPWVAPVLRALDQAHGYLDRAERMRMTAADRSVLARVLAGLEAARELEESVTERGAAAHGTTDPEGGRWVPAVSVGLSVGMLVAAFVALGYHTPNVTPVRRPAPAASGPRPALAAGLGASAVPPTVEALPKAASTRRGAPLVRADRPLAPETPLYEGDVVRGVEGPGCARIEPATEVCIGPASELVLRKLSRGERVLELVRGRAVLTLESVTVPVRVIAGPVSLRAERGTFGLERDEPGVVVRALLGRAEVEAYGRVQELSAEAMLARAQGDTVERFALLPEKARRDWELFAAHRPGSAKSAPAAGAARSVEQGAEPAAEADATSPTPSSPTPSSPTSPSATPPGATPPPGVEAAAGER
jgi:DNA-directed RNA polymerase specialized sigma24 family protein